MDVAVRYTGVIIVHCILGISKKCSLLPECKVRAFIKNNSHTRNGIMEQIEPIKVDLFRFVTLREPQLLSQKKV